MAPDLQQSKPAAAPTSAARLAAEAAFAAPDKLPEIGSTPAQVTVRRAKLAVWARPVPAADAPPAAELVGKAPRVFRLQAAQAPAPAPAPAGVSPLPAAARRQRRVAADKRPGQVLHVVHIQTRPAEVAAVAARSAALAVELARLAPVREAIQRAQSFCFIDERVEQKWQRLSAQAKLLLVQLQAGRRSKPARSRP